MTSSPLSSSSPASTKAPGPGQEHKAVKARPASPWLAGVLLCFGWAVGCATTSSGPDTNQDNLGGASTSTTGGGSSTVNTGGSTTSSSGGSSDAPADDAGTGGTSSECGAGMGMCSGVCTDLTTDERCGTCTRVCRYGTSCVDQVCTCVAPKQECSGACVDTTSDAANCGACGKACDAGQACSNSTCSCDTANGYLNCANNTCYNTKTSTAHCGACNHACASTYSCINGSCSCATGETTCTSNGTTVCSDLKTDSNNCGGCGNKCASGTYCKGDGSFTCIASPCAGIAECNGLTVSSVWVNSSNTAAAELKGEPLTYTTSSSYEAKDTLRTYYRCWNVSGRTISVNGQAMNCDAASHALPARLGGGYCVYAPAGGTRGDAGFGLGNYAN